MTSFLYDSIKGPKKIITDNVETDLTWENDKLIGYGNILFEYNELGQRIKKTSTSNVTNYYYDDDLLIRSEKNNIVFDYLYDINNQLIGFIYDNQEYIYVRDILGNINKIVDSTGCIMVNYNYTAYGEVTISNPYSDTHEKYQLANVIIENNIFLYKGYCYDVETGLFWLSSRYYSPELCRFISPDSVDYLDPSSINGLNLYSYCGNDPINKYDPSGHSAILIGMLIGFGVGALIGGGFEIAKQAYNGGNWNWDMSSWNWGQIGLSALGGAVAGAISSISFGSGVVGYLTTFATGGVGSVLGGMISGSVTDLQSGLIAFGIGAVANVAARGITALINKGVSASAQKALSNPIFDDMTLGDLVGSGLKNNGYAPAYNKFLNYAGNLVLKANGQWARSSMYSFANVGISSLLSGWY